MNRRRSRKVTSAAPPRRRRGLRPHSRGTTATTVAYGRNDKIHDDNNAFLAESTHTFGLNAVYGRYEASRSRAMCCGSARTAAVATTPRRSGHRIRRRWYSADARRACAPSAAGRDGMSAAAATSRSTGVPDSPQADSRRAAEVVSRLRARPLARAHGPHGRHDDDEDRPLASLTSRPLSQAKRP